MQKSIEMIATSTLASSVHSLSVEDVDDARLRSRDHSKKTLSTYINVSSYSMQKK